MERGSYNRHQAWVSHPNRFGPSAWNYSSELGKERGMGEVDKSGEVNMISHLLLKYSLRHQFLPGHEKISSKSRQEDAFSTFYQISHPTY